MIIRLEARTDGRGALNTRTPILPGTGRGTTRRVVEGHRPHVLTFHPRLNRGRPSTMLRMVPLPRRGRI
ncbi:hypothetical protein WSK_2480 [Novosphingobium sp. Rr 2-17]|nr:hypothetical protein WSK_2480 [Novosphingobium sp. Rr 2-17]